MDDINLKHKWIIYDLIKKKNYIDGLSVLGTCSTVFEYWTCMKYVVKPSKIFFHKTAINNGKNSAEIKPYYKENNEIREISSILFFKEGIQPIWEDFNNKSIIEIRRIHNDNILQYLDEVFDMLSQYCVTDLLEYVNGFRIVDSSHEGKAMYRIELWSSEKDPSCIELFKKIVSTNDIIIKKNQLIK